MPRGQPASRKREAAVAALLVSGTFAEAAAKARISERTLRTWLRDPSFKACYRQARTQLLEHSLGVLQGASISAVMTLLRNLTCGRPACEIAAANSLLEHGTAALTEFDILTRLEALEAQAAQQGANHVSGFNGTATNGTPRGGLGR